jgi:hypothetical protein
VYCHYMVVKVVYCIYTYMFVERNNKDRVNGNKMARSTGQVNQTEAVASYRSLVQ